MMINTLEPESYKVQLYDNRLEIFVDQNGMKFPRLGTIYILRNPSFGNFYFFDHFDHFLLLLFPM